MIPESRLMVEELDSAMPPRKPKTYKLDERLIQALEELAEGVGESAGSYVEKVLWKHCQGRGAIPINDEPQKDQRGGKRENAGRKPHREAEEQLNPEG